MATRIHTNNGDIVRVAHGSYPGLWRVTSVRGTVNAVLEPLAGGRRLRCPYSLLMPADGDGDPDGAGITVTAEDIPQHFYEGTLVRIADHSRFAGLYVVIRDTGGDKVNVARIGGDNGRYVRAYRGNLTQVDPAEVMAVTV